MPTAITRVVDGYQTGAINLTCVTVNAPDGAIAGGRFNHSKVIALMEAARAAWNSPGYRPSADQMHMIANGVEVLSRHWTVQETYPVEIVAGPITGSAIQGFLLTTHTLGNNGTPGPIVAQRFVPYLALDDMNLPAFPVIQVLP